MKSGLESFFAISLSISISGEIFISGKKNNKNAFLNVGLELHKDQIISERAFSLFTLYDKLSKNFVIIFYLIYQISCAQMYLFVYYQSTLQINILHRVSASAIIALDTFAKILRILIFYACKLTPVLIT